MIARHWHAQVPKRDAKNYERLMVKIAIPYYEAVEGVIDYCFLKSVEGEEIHFDLFTYWEDYDAIKKFAGEDDIHKAKYFSEDKTYLFDFEPTVKHYEVFARKEIQAKDE